MFISRASCASHGDERPVTTLFQTWIFCIMVPTAAVVYGYTGRPFLSLFASLVVPVVAISQGSLGILLFRLHFGDAPLPLKPSHGVVVVVDPDASGSYSQKNKKCFTKQLSLGCECNIQHDPLGSHHSEVTVVDCSPAAAGGEAATFESETDEIRIEEPECFSNKSSIEEDPRRPIRLLVIGDSLAIGVGQSKQCVPIMPETIAKTVSRELGGRVVYWTCHGAPGASTGWIVRELEQGVQLNDVPMKRTGSQQEEEMQSCSDTDDSSSSDGSTSSKSESMDSEEERIWRHRLKQHRRRFNLTSGNDQALGPYDIVVVFTGSNDLKSAFFPFLLTGEDAEFRRQAKARGGNYTKELRRLLRTLNKQMQRSMQTIRYSVEVATETVIERVEETMERITHPCSATKAHDHPSSSFRERLDARRSTQDSIQASDDDDSDDEQRDSTTHPHNDYSMQHQTQFPIVVLPGLPARALPIFRKAPLRWLAVPIVDILDMHKRGLAQSHPGEVVFVPPPSIDDLTEYENCRGEFWQQRSDEQIALCLRDVRKHECRRIEADLRTYYQKKDLRIATGQGIIRKTPWSWRRPAPGSSIFSVDTIHPTDDGYDFWGRYIAKSIVQEWKQQHSS
jgi:hypothetical protein